MTWPRPRNRLSFMGNKDLYLGSSSATETPSLSGWRCVNAWTQTSLCGLLHRQSAGARHVSVATLSLPQTGSEALDVWLFLLRMENPSFAHAKKPCRETPSILELSYLKQHSTFNCGERISTVVKYVLSMQVSASVLKTQITLKLPVYNLKL